jgi:nucleotide-binding universal stress UspA family protein
VSAVVTRRRVVVAVAEAQPATLQFAMEEARKSARELEVVHCAGYTNYAARIVDHLYFENWLEAADHVLDDARRFVTREFDPPRSRYRMSDQPPLDELLEVSTDAAEIIVGSDDQSWFSRMLGPAVAQGLAREARCPVVVVPEPALLPIASDGVVVGIEGTHPEEHVLRYAFEHADHRGRRLHVIHAHPRDAWVGEVQEHHRAIGEALAGWSEKFPDVTVTRSFVGGEPTGVCARATARAELVVVGQPRPSQASFVADKPMSTALLRRARGPVAVVPEVLS